MSRKRPLAAALYATPVVAEPQPDAELVAPPPVPADELLTLDGVAALLKVHPTTVRRMAAMGTFPSAIKMPTGFRAPDSSRHAQARWSSNEVQGWIAQQLAQRAG